MFHHQITCTVDFSLFLTVVKQSALCIIRKEEKVVASPLITNREIQALHAFTQTAAGFPK